MDSGLEPSQPGEHEHRQVLCSFLSDPDNSPKTGEASPSDADLSPTILSPIVPRKISESLVTDINTQMSLIERSEDLHINDERTSFWDVINSDLQTEHDHGDGISGGRKVLKASRQSDASSALTANISSEEESKMKVFDAALASTDFNFRIFGSEGGAVITFSATDSKNGGEIVETANAAL